MRLRTENFTATTLPIDELAGGAVPIVPSDDPVASVANTIYGQANNPAFVVGKMLRETATGLWDYFQQCMGRKPKRTVAASLAPKVEEVVEGMDFIEEAGAEVEEKAPILGDVFEGRKSEEKVGLSSTKIVADRALRQSTSAPLECCFPTDSPVDLCHGVLDFNELVNSTVLTHHIDDITGGHLYHVSVYNFDFCKGHRLYVPDLQAYATTNGISYLSLLDVYSATRSPSAPDPTRRIPITLTNSAWSAYRNYRISFCSDASPIPTVYPDIFYDLLWEQVFIIDPSKVTKVNNSFSETLGPVQWHEIGYEVPISHWRNGTEVDITQFCPPPVTASPSPSPSPTPLPTSTPIPTPMPSPLYPMIDRCTEAANSPEIFNKSFFNIDLTPSRTINITRSDFTPPRTIALIYELNFCMGHRLYIEDYNFTNSSGVVGLSTGAIAWTHDKWTVNGFIHPTIAICSSFPSAYWNATGSSLLNPLQFLVNASGHPLYTHSLLHDLQHNVSNITQIDIGRFCPRGTTGSPSTTGGPTSTTGSSSISTAIASTSTTTSGVGGMTGVGVSTTGLSSSQASTTGAITATLSGSGDVAPTSGRSSGVDGTSSPKNVWQPTAISLGAVLGLTGVVIAAIFTARKCKEKKEIAARNKNVAFAMKRFHGTGGTDTSTTNRAGTYGDHSEADTITNQAGMEL